MTALDHRPEEPAYEAVAAGYDLLTAGYEYDRWSRDIEALALAHGLRGRRLLDVACGTGKSFGWFLGRGYDVCATDISPAMAAVARVHGLRAAAVRGVATGGRLEPYAGEDAHPKVVVLASRKEAPMPFRP